jgi:hypothetical protein
MTHRTADVIIEHLTVQTNSGGRTCRGGPEEVLKLLPFENLSQIANFQVADQLLQAAGEGVIVVSGPEVDRSEIQI